MHEKDLAYKENSLKLLKDSSSKFTNGKDSVHMEVIRKLNDDSYLLGGDVNDKVT